MLSDEKVLITGPAGRIASGLARSLAADNEVGRQESQVHDDDDADHQQRA